MRVVDQDLRCARFPNRGVWRNCVAALVALAAFLLLNPRPVPADATTNDVASDCFNEESLRRRRALTGAPTLSRRSDNEIPPPTNMISAPSQMNRTSGLK
jgi:hypothetical protein